MDVRRIAEDETDAFTASVAAGFHLEATEATLAHWGGQIEPGRTRVAVEADGRFVANAAVLSRELTLPGGRAEPAAFVTMIGVQATHRRRGLMSRMLGELHAEAPEALAVLWASEGGIYGRFGYGPAAWYRHLRLAPARAALRADAPPAAPAALREPGAVRDALVAIYEAARPGRPGMPTRSERWWTRVLADPEEDREGASPLRAALLDDGTGYALYRVTSKWDDEGPASTCHVEELVAATPQAHAALWRLLLGLDLVRTVEWDGAPADEPLPHLLADPRAAAGPARESLWVALLDAPRALAARAYAAPLDLVLDAGEAGRVHLRAGADGAAEARPAPEAPADLVLDREALGAAYLGGTSLRELHAAGRVREGRPGALAAAATAFAAERAPWCPDVF